MPNPSPLSLLVYFLPFWRVIPIDRPACVKHVCCPDSPLRCHSDPITPFIPRSCLIHFSLCFLPRPPPSSSASSSLAVPVTFPRSLRWPECCNWVFYSSQLKVQALLETKQVCIVAFFFSFSFLFSSSGCLIIYSIHSLYHSVAKEARGMCFHFICVIKLFWHCLQCNLSFPIPLPPTQNPI